MVAPRPHGSPATSTTSAGIDADFMGAGRVEMPNTERT